MRAKGPDHYLYILGTAVNHYVIKPKVSICFKLQLGLENWHFSVKKLKANLLYIYYFFDLFEKNINIPNGLYFATQPSLFLLTQKCQFSRPDCNLKSIETLGFSL